MKSVNLRHDSQKERNYQMCILSTIAICFVVLGHVRYGILDMTEFGTFYGWFPYYSFHLPIFLFISGYFFKDLPEGAGIFKPLKRFIFRKFKNLLLPYYIVTGIFLLAGFLLLRWGFTWTQTFSFTTWLVDPWTKLYTITFGVPAWYLVSLFIAEMYFMFLRLTIRKLLKKLLRSDIFIEILFLVICLALGVFALYIHGLKGVTQTASVYLRSVLMLFFIQTGLLYRRYIEERDTLGSVPYFLLLFLVQFLIILISGNCSLSPGLFGLVNFEAFGYDYFLAGITGVALYLRISRLLASIPGESRLVLHISGSTRFIMSFHILGFFLLNALFSLLRRMSFLQPFLENFQDKRWHEYLYYTLTNDPCMIPLYLFAGVGISLLIAQLVHVVKHLIHKRIAR